ncbi:MAG: HEPN domain protein, partial [Candidatus Wolfebacteria bacterium GW2011_GWE1_48_7]
SLWTVKKLSQNCMSNLTKQEVKKSVVYWQTVAKHDYETMVGLFKLKRYSDSLFYGHLVLEKTLKALVVKNTGAHPKPIHNLSVLAQDAGIDLSKEDREFLAEVSKFNIYARYPDYKLSFYKLCNLEYTKPRIEKIKALFKKLW